MCKIMGIINATPDSFSDGGRFAHVDTALQHATQLIQDGAEVLDIGGESTRPGFTPVDADEEWARIAPVINAIRTAHPNVMLSVDTSKAVVAARAIASGVNMINDVSALGDPDMVRVVVDANIPVVLMHMHAPSTPNVVHDVRDYLATRAEFFIAQGGKHEHVWIDPGIGFNKNTAQSIELSAHLDVLVNTGFPVLYGPSRKRFLGDITGRAPQDRDIATATACAFAAGQGAQMVRVHHVQATHDAMCVMGLLTKTHRSGIHGLHPMRP